MKNFFRIISYIHIPKNKLALYIFYTLLGTFFSVFSIAMFAPFLSIIFNTSGSNVINSNAVGSLKYYLNDIAMRNRLLALGIVCLFIIAATLFKNLFFYLSYRISNPVKNMISYDFRLRLYQKILMLPVGFFTDQKKGDLMSRMIGDVNEVNGAVIGSLESLIKDSLTTIAFLAYMVYLSPRLSLFLLIALPITAFVIGRINRKLKHFSSNYSVVSGESLSHVEETLTGIKIVKAFNAEKKMLQKFKSGNLELLRILNSISIRRDLSSPLTELMGVTVLCMILFVGGLTVLSSHSLSASDLLNFVFGFAMIINPAKNLSGSISNVQKGMAAVERLEEIIQAPIGIEEKPNAIPLTAFNRSIELRNVSFSYGEKDVLKNINLIIEKGKTVALVGSSGAGKSTLVDLIPRFHDVTSGEILIDGINIKEYTIPSLRSQMSIVTQEPILFNDTIASNIALGKETYTENEVMEAAKIANAHNFIIYKEDKYNTNIGDRGMKLSGGERQRVTIARAVLQNPPILILDEATSSLDTESERLVQDAIIHLMQDRTSIVIAHRLSTVRNADEIIVLQKGEIIERGTHESLIALNGFYSKLVNMQEVK
ncbi:ABC transporter ATP-binding protein [Ferruginibacter albus]|uniref:ABC transporter ATP-binding protein n=1 Tax=Ferruginibacter albus TaxID=2875540 RepID=UPI001CC6BB0E|nr:ABC transporter ATP-binding protein [Ferruginibacter albus]UAY52504.1 ABC transporter ATP-binding protein/permease [Ferruginibacter albus]